MTILQSTSKFLPIASPYARFGSFQARNRRGLTVLELSVVLCILTLFVAIAVPIALRARESSREVKCAANLKVLLTALQNYELTFGHYPSNGWGYRWVGEPGRRPGAAQPGSWAYSALPHIEQSHLAGIQALGDAGSALYSTNALLSQPIPVLNCPSRGANVLAYNDPNTAPYNAKWMTMVFRADYACNEGDRHLKTGPGPASLAEETSYAWADGSLATGVMFQRSEIGPREIMDGLSNTYFLGEKYVFTGDYRTINSPGYDQCAFVGADLDTNRCTSYPPTSDTVFLGGLPNSGARYFGSAHPDFCWFAYGDGAVRRVSYTIDEEVHRMAGNRADKLSSTELAAQLR